MSVLDRRISQQQLESYLWGAATLLRGTIDAGDYKQFIFPLLFYKRLCDVYDEEVANALAESGGDQDFALFPENHRFQIPSEAHWREVRKVPTNVGQALQNAMRAIESANTDKLYGIFGDAQWTNKERLSDSMLRDLIEHFSTLELTVANLPEDELGQGYEYLIKKFADDSGHTAAEFYTNRTVVHLMTELLQPQPGESIYDPTCGSGGMLLSAVTHLRRQGKEWRNVKLYGQERNLMTSSIARMNCFLHGIEDFNIVRGDTLSEPKLVEGDKLMQFDVVLANPPYSIKQWDRSLFSSDPWGRNLFGVPPQGRADYAFQQHIIKSLKPESGRCAVLWPHGVLFRQEEAEMRRKLIETDLIECVIGLGPNLFYNSPMEACIMICRTDKPTNRRGKVMFINAVKEVARERAQSFLTDQHIERILLAYKQFQDIPGFAAVVTMSSIREKDGNLSVPLYVETGGDDCADKDEGADLDISLKQWLGSSATLRHELSDLLKISEISNWKPNPDLKSLLFESDNWKRVRFGDVVSNINETEKNPEEASIERFIGLEHLEPGSLHVREWGDIKAGTTFTRTCRPGHVLFGKRRAYQRKVAVAEFNAVVSGDIYVLAPKNELLLPELLPFICISDRFFRHAVGTSAGSLSPRTNWSSLGSFEFDLPPIDQQRHIVSVCNAIINSLQRTEQLATAAARTLESIRSALVTNVPTSWRRHTISDLQTLITDQVDPAEEPYSSMILVAPNHIDEGSGRILTNETAKKQGVVSTKHLFQQGDILYSKIRPNLRKVVLASFTGITTSDTFVVRPDKTLAPQLLLAVLLSKQFTDYAILNSNGTAFPRINRNAFLKFEVPIPPEPVQREICNRIASLDAVIKSAHNKKSHTNSLLHAFLNRTIGYA